MIVAGIDGYGRGSWVAVVLDAGRFVRALAGPSIGELLPRLADAVVIGIDIPIGLPDGTAPRRADVLARKRLGRRASTVFLTPPRPVLEAPTHREASRIAAELTGKGVSLQAYGIGARILEVEPFARSDDRIREVHPEVSFAALAGSVVDEPKHTWGGTTVRRGLLAGAGITLPDVLGEADAVPVDDVLDAAIAAWSADRIARRAHLTLPDPPDIDAGGLVTAIHV